MSEPVSGEWRALICEKLAQIERDDGVKVLLAVESGSRAWGFHSPDSDYDVRFIYARPIDWHLHVEPGRDVLEYPISGELDISGWDLRKTLGLILGSNAVVLEWLQSPITYAQAPGFRDILTDFARQSLARKPVLWHYRRLAERQSERLINDDGSLRLKRYFYLIRPVLALRWLRLHPDLATPPMDMGQLMLGCALPDNIQRAILDLIDRKKTLAESDDILESPGATDALIAEELALCMAELEAAAARPRADTRVAADAILADWTRRYDPTRNGDGP
jgi:predicted nucleotidyltransferase